MKRARRVMRSVASAAGAALFVLAACSDAPTPQPCTAIPAGGCPLFHGLSCDDPTCEAIYACRPGDRWELDHVCPPHEAGAGYDAAAQADAGEAAPPRDANVDAPPGAFGGPGCIGLQPPDCSAGFALSCPSGCCGCEDLFVCEDEEWRPWGSCENGVISSP